MKIGLVAPVKPTHPYLENDPAPLFDLHYLCIPPWLWFSLGSPVFLKWDLYFGLIPSGMPLQYGTMASRRYRKGTLRWVSTDRDAVSVVTEPLGDRLELPEGNTASS